MWDPHSENIEVGGCAGQLRRVPCSPCTGCYHTLRHLSLVLLLLDGEGSASLACLDSLLWGPLVITVHLLLCFRRWTTLGRSRGGEVNARGGQAWKALGSCESLPVKKGGPGQELCSSCGLRGMKFVSCETCSGSCKVFVSEDGEEENGGFVICKDCNENGFNQMPSLLLIMYSDFSFFIASNFPFFIAKQLFSYASYLCK